MDLPQLLVLVIGLVLGAVIGAIATLAFHRTKANPTTVAAAEVEQRLRVEQAKTTSAEERARAEIAEARRESATAREDAAHARVEAAELRTEAQAARADVAEALAQRSEVAAELEAMRAKFAASQIRVTEAEARAEQIAQDRETQVNQFKVLSESTLEAQAEKANQSAEARFKATEQLMTPVHDALKQLQERITSVEKDRVALSTELRGQVQAVQSTGEHLRRETHALVTALRKPQIRGNWGEMQLKNAAELAGMMQHCDFDLQHSTITTGGAGIRPDMRVNLSDGKCVFVDSKVPLEGFLDAHDTDDETVREAALERFGKNVKGHVDQLSAKQYWAVDDHSPEFVIMFLPSEALAAEALSRMPDLHEYAIRKDIVIASPSTLIAMLRTVGYSWKQAALAQNAKEVADLGRELFQRLAKMGGHFDRLGRSLTAAVKTYNQTLGSLEGRVLVTARRMNDLGVTSEEIPALTALEEGPRVVTAPELIDDATQTIPWKATLPEAAELTRGDQLFDMSELEERAALRQARLSS